MLLAVDPEHRQRWFPGSPECALAKPLTEAIELQSQEVYERYIKYLTGCAKQFRAGYIDVNQFTLQK